MLTLYGHNSLTTRGGRIRTGPLQNSLFFSCMNRMTGWWNSCHPLGTDKTGDSPLQCPLSTVEENRNSLQVSELKLICVRLHRCCSTQSSFNSFHHTFIFQNCFLVTLTILLFATQTHTCSHWQKKKQRKEKNMLRDSANVLSPTSSCNIDPLLTGAAAAPWCDLRSDGKSSASVLIPLLFLCHSLKGTKKQLPLHYSSAITIRRIRDCYFLAS